MDCMLIGESSDVPMNAHPVQVEVCGWYEDDGGIVHSPDDGAVDGWGVYVRCGHEAVWLADFTTRDGALAVAGWLCACPIMHLALRDQTRAEQEA